MSFAGGFRRVRAAVYVIVEGNGRYVIYENWRFRFGFVMISP